MKAQRQSEMILRLLDAALEVEASVTTHGPSIARRLEERFAPRLYDGARVDFLATLFALRDELAASREKLSAAELRHIDLLDQITILSLEREDLLASLQDDYTWLRGKLAKLGRKVVAVTGVQGPTAAGTTKLLRQVKVSIHLLSKPGLVLPPGRLGETAPEPQQIATQLEKKARRLREVKKRLGRTRRKAQRTMVEKNETVERHRATLYPVCRTLEGFYRLAGEDELADQILPPTPRRRRVIELEPALDPDAPEPDAVEPEEPGAAPELDEPDAEASDHPPDVEKE